MNAIVDKAREYLNTPFHHQGRVKGVGVDCVGLVICVGKELGYASSDFNYTGYSRMPDGRVLSEQLGMHLKLIEREEMQPGDVVCVAFDIYPQHVGIIGDYRHGGLSIIHAAGKHKKVIETRLMFSEAMRFVAAYRFPSI